MKSDNSVLKFINPSNMVLPSILILIMIGTRYLGNYLIFHSFSELFSIFVAFTITFVTYFTYTLTKNKYLLFLGLGYFWVGLLDMIHIQTYPGMKIYDIDGMNPTLTFWVLTRFFEAMLFLLAPIMRNKDFSIPKTTLIFAIYSFFVAWLAMSSSPLMLFDDESGLSTLKLVYEYGIVIILLGALKLNKVKKSTFHTNIYIAVQTAIVFTIISEAFFTLYTDAYGFTNLMGHIFKFLSFWVLLVSIIRISFKEPIKLMAKEASSYNAIPVPAVLVSNDGIIRQANDASLKYLGMEPSQVIGRSNHELFHPSDLTVQECPICQAIQNKEAMQEVEFTDIIKDVTTQYSLSFIDIESQQGTIQVCVNVTKRKKAEDELREQKMTLNYQAHHDALTKLPNRILFHNKLELGIKKSEYNKCKLALFFIDLDHFKEINDSLGHIVGDEILKLVTQRLSKTIRKEDVLARLGGDEFTIIMGGITQTQDASVLAEKILEALSVPLTIDNNVLHVSCSIGISFYPEDGDNAHDLLKHADVAMYDAKDNGRNNFKFYSSEMSELLFERVVMEASLREAINKEEFVVYYQPQVNAETGKLIGVEGLVRWQHPNMGIVLPEKFIPLLEKIGLIIQLDRWVMKKAMFQMAQWYSQGLNPGVLSLNLAIKQLEQKNFIDTLKMMMEETGCKPQWIGLEVTEGQIMNNPDKAIGILNELSDMGIELAVDDYGTGYSSLSYLKRLPIDKLKIDQSFIKDLPDDEEDATITKSVITLAQSLNLKVIAEGVETEVQKNFLVENGCKNIQGYFYGKPMQAVEMEEIFLKGLST